jgi:hypothetical protein
MNFLDLISITTKQHKNKINYTAKIRFEPVLTRIVNQKRKEVIGFDTE